MKFFKFETLESWLYDPYHVISDLKKVCNYSLYMHQLRQKLEKFANQDDFLKEINVWDKQVYSGIIDKQKNHFERVLSSVQWIVHIIFDLSITLENPLGIPSTHDLS